MRLLFVTIFFFITSTLFAQKDTTKYGKTYDAIYFQDSKATNDSLHRLPIYIVDDVNVGNEVHLKPKTIKTVTITKYSNPRELIYTDTITIITKKYYRKQKIKGML
jgi:hypothetical protein